MHQWGGMVELSQYYHCRTDSIHVHAHTLKWQCQNPDVRTFHALNGAMTETRWHKRSTFSWTVTENIRSHIPRALQAMTFASRRHVEPLKSCQLFATDRDHKFNVFDHAKLFAQYITYVYLLHTVRIVICACMGYRLTWH